MGKARRASTLIMVLCVFGFIVMIGVGVMTLAGVANQQASHTLGQQQADFAAQSVLDTVSAQIVDKTIDPFALGKGSAYKSEGSGSDDVLGNYTILIEKYDGGGSDNVFKVAVTAERNGFTSSMYNLLSYTSGGDAEIDLSRLFDVVAGATNLNPNASMLPSTPGSSGSEGSVFFDNGEYATTFTGGRGVTKNVDAVGPLTLGVGTFGTQGGDTHIQSTDDIKITTSGVIYSTVRSEKNVVVGQSQNIPNDIYANGDVTVKNGAVVKGDIHAGGTVTLEGWGAGVEGTIYANGTQKEDGTVEGGNVVITAGAVAQGDIYAGGTVTLDGYNGECKGTIYAGGDVTVQNSASANAVKSNGNVTVKNDIYNGAVGSVECMGNVDLNGRFTGEVRANGNGRIAGQYNQNVYIAGEVDVVSITQMQEVHSDTVIRFTDMEPCPASAYPRFYAPEIAAQNSDLSYCSLYAQGKAADGTITLTNCKASAASGSPMPEYYAGGDIRITNCNNLKLVRIYTNGNLMITDSTLTKDSWSADTNSIRAWGGIEVQGGEINGSFLAGGDIDISGALVKADLSANRYLSLENVTAQGGQWQCNEDMSISGTFETTSTNISTAGDFNMILTRMTQSTSVNFTVNGAANFENVDLYGNMNVIGGGSFRNAAASGTLLFGAQPAIDNASLQGLSVVDPATITPAAPLAEMQQADVPSGAGSITEIKKVDIPYDEMPLVDLKLQEKYANLPEWKIPEAIDAQIKQKNVTLYFNKEDPGYTVDDKDYIVNQSCTLSVDFQRGGGNIYGKRLVFDATDGDLYIRLKSADKKDNTFLVPSGVHILSKGDYNVYLFLDEGTNASDYLNFGLSGNTFMGYYDYAGGVPQDDTRTPNLYLITNAKGVTIDISKYNTAYAYFYAPQGSVRMTGSTIFSGGAKLYGSAVASYIEMGDNQRYIQYTPQGTAGGEGETGIDGWTVVGTYAGTEE